MFQGSLAISGVELGVKLHLNISKLSKSSHMFGLFFDVDASQLWVYDLHGSTSNVILNICITGIYTAFWYLDSYFFWTLL